MRNIRRTIDNLRHQDQLKLIEGLLINLNDFEILLRLCEDKVQYIGAEKKSDIPEFHHNLNEFFICGVKIMGTSYVPSGEIYKVFKCE